MKPLTLVGLGVLLIASQSLSVAYAQAPAMAVEARRAAEEITAPVIAAHTKFLASDLLEGRAPSTRGDRLAMAYVASQMEALGLKPAAPGGGWIQKVPLVAITPKVPETMTLSGADGKQLSFRYRDDFMAFSGVQKPSASIEGAELVFVGYGIVAPEYSWNDYKDVGVKGKVLVMMNNDPEDDPNLFAGKRRLWYGRWDYKYIEAARQGAVGAIIIHTTHSAGYPWQVVRTSWAGAQYELPYEGEPRVQIKGWATEEASRKIAALGGKDLDQLRAAAEKRDFRPVPLGVKLTFALQNSIETVESGNVIGKLTGSDPKLAGEAVLYTAHHDHFGIKEGAAPGADAIYNGARDNASGVAAMLAVARAFTRLPKPPRRSILFASVTSEEQGLLGSAYLAKHPPVPAGDFAANINIDTVNIWGKTKDIVSIALGKSSLDAVIQELAAMQGRTVKPDAFPDKGFFYRSDQFNLARIGVPAAHLDTGVDFVGRPAGWGEKTINQWEATDYHQPSDEYRDWWDLSGAVEDVQLNFYLGLSVANADRMPSWNKGDEFEAVRKKALAELPPR